MQPKKRGTSPKALTQSTTKKAEILKAAQHIVVQHGVGQLTFDRIVKEAGVAKGTLLYHFKNKDNLLLELVKNYVEHLDEQLKLGIAAAQNSSNTVASGFAHWYRHFYATAQTNSSFGVAILSYSAQNETLRAPIREWYEKVFDMAKNGRRRCPGCFVCHSCCRRSLLPPASQSQYIDSARKRTGDQACDQTF